MYTKNAVGTQLIWFPALKSALMKGRATEIIVSSRYEIAPTDAHARKTWRQ
jgi:hypothetical protein